MNMAEAKPLLKAFANGGEWSDPDYCGYIWRQVAGRRSFIHYCCGLRMWKVFNEGMAKEGLRAPPKSRYRRKRYLIRFECGSCGYTHDPDDS